MAPRTAWYRRSRWYGDASNVTRPNPRVLSLEEVMRRLACSPTATARLRQVVGASTKEKPLAYRGRAPNGSLSLYRWGLVRIRNNAAGLVLLWPTVLGRRAWSRLPKLAPLRREASVSVLVAALESEP